MWFLFQYSFILWPIWYTLVKLEWEIKISCYTLLSTHRSCCYQPTKLFDASLRWRLANTKTFSSPWKHTAIYLHRPSYVSTQRYRKIEKEMHKKIDTLTHLRDIKCEEVLGHATGHFLILHLHRLLMWEWTRTRTIKMKTMTCTLFDLEETKVQILEALGRNYLGRLE